MLTANNVSSSSISSKEQTSSARVDDEKINIPILDGAVAGGDDTECPARLVMGNALGSFSQADFL